MNDAQEARASVREEALEILARLGVPGDALARAIIPNLTMLHRIV